jgi:hypothetical protein
MNLRTALANIHRDPFWWRKILIGGALMLTIVGYPWAAGLVMESLDNTRKGFPTPLPPWREWSLRYIIGLFAVLIDILFFGLPIFVAGLVLLCVATLAISAGQNGPPWLAALAVGGLALYELLVFAASISPVGRLLYVDVGRSEDALGMRTVRAALAPRARRIYGRARLLSLPAYLPFALFALASWLIGGPVRVVLIWLALSALLYAHLVVVQLYAAAESDVRFG